MGGYHQTGAPTMSDTPKEIPLADSVIASRLKAELPEWRLENGAIQRVYRTHSWKGTLMVINTVGHLSEAAWHHPEIAADYASVTVRLNTHSAKGITDKDFALAAKIEEVVMWQPNGDGGLPGTPEGDQRFAYIRHGR
jgi:4a-hydroxytetrahydrobiopterin dehydratase